MANMNYRKSMVKIANGEIDFTNDTFKVMLVTSSYTPSQTHEFRSDVTNEVSGTGYTSGGATVDLTVYEDTTNNCAKIDSADVTWSNATITARGAILYKSTGNASTDPIITYYDFGSDKSSTDGDFTLVVHADGWLSLGKSS